MYSPLITVPFHGFYLMGKVTEEEMEGEALAYNPMETLKGIIMAKCKFCTAPIIWKSIGGKWVPHDASGERHSCLTKGPPLTTATITTSTPAEAFKEEMKPATTVELPGGVGGIYVQKKEMMEIINPLVEMIYGLMLAVDVSRKDINMHIKRLETMDEDAMRMVTNYDGTSLGEERRKQLLELARSKGEDAIPMSTKGRRKKKKETDDGFDPQPTDKE